MSALLSSAAAQQQFTNLRKRLDQLGYKHPLGVESLPLVERLFSDLIHTTESLKKAKQQAGRGQQERGAIDAHIEPYKSDNAKLVKENNELHQQLLKQREELDTSIKDLKASLRKKEHDNADLQFLNNQYIHKIRALEKESKQKSDRILILQEKNFHAVVQTPGGRKKHIPFRRQRMELDGSAPPSDTSSVNTQSFSSAPYVADLLKVAEENIEQLRDENTILREKTEGLNNKITNYRKQVETRDTEIDRLSRMLEGGRPYDVVALETRNRSNERLISHLNIQIDYLQQKNQEIQKQLDASLSKARVVTDQRYTLEDRNVELEQSLHDVNRLAQQSQVEKDVVIRTADKEVAGAQQELRKSRLELETMDSEVAQYKAEKERLLSDVESLKAELDGQCVENQRVQQLLGKVQEDKRKLSQRVNKLTSNEKDLVLEIDRLKHRHGTVRKRGKANPMDTFMKGLEEERDYWKGEVDVLQKLLKAKSASSRSSSPNRSRSQFSSPNRSRTTPTKKKKSASPSSSFSERQTSTSNDALVRVLEEERDHYKRECEILKALRSRPSSPIRADRSFSEDSELQKVIRERDELQALLDKFERHMAEIKANVKVLTMERDRLSNMYEETKEELTRQRREVARSPKSPKTSLAAQAVLRRVENERDDAQGDLRRITTERDTLREKLKITTDTRLADRARLEQRVEDLENNLHIIEVERNDLEVKCRSLQLHVENLTDEMKRQTLQITDAHDEAAQQKATSTQMRLITQQAEQSLEETHQRMTQREAMIRELEEKVLRLQQRLEDMERTHQLDIEEICRLKAAIAALDREKDLLQGDIDDKTERAVQFREEIAVKDRIINELNFAKEGVETILDNAKDSLSGREHELASLRRQLDNTTAELTEVGRAREVALRENRRLQDDLGTMTNENQSLNQDLHRAEQEGEQMKEQLQQYVMEVKNVEDLLASKEKERTDLLQQYQALHLEAEKYETQTHQLESESSTLRLDIMTKENEIRRLRERLQFNDRDMQEHMNAGQQYQLQVSRLTSAVEELEERLRAADHEKHELMQDLSAVRDLCTQLEAGKASLHRQLTAKSLDEERLKSMIDDMEEETDALKTQVEKERTSARSLEGLVQINREKEFSTQLTVKEKDAESHRLKDRLALNESKMDSQAREMTMLRTKNIELDSEIERYKRQLTNEKFERERAVQELRRHGVGSPGQRLGSPSARPSSRSRSLLTPTMDDDPLASTHTSSFARCRSTPPRKSIRKW